MEIIFDLKSNSGQMKSNDLIHRRSCRSARDTLVNALALLLIRFLYLYNRENLVIIK
jgi:hypothetical protein